MLQNRVDPQGNIICTAARGAWMGNRGILHDENKHILRPFKLKAWLICQLEFKGRKREVMAPNRYTELFFMDEVTALAAGHRPCFECRREDFNCFKKAWLKGNPEYGFDEKISIQQIDAVLHSQRIDRKKQKLTYEELPENLPDGAFVLYKAEPHLLWHKELFLWTISGYKKSIGLPAVAKFAVLTPKSTVNALRAGYQAQHAEIKR